MVASLAAAALLAPGGGAAAQSIEPRSWSNAPVGVNFLIIGAAWTQGALAVDTNLPAVQPEVRTVNPFVSYVRTLDLWGKSAKFDVAVPYTWLDGTASFRSRSSERTVNGFGDPTARLSVNFYGAPALTLPEFRAWEQDVIVGASLQVSAPAGQYDSSKLINIGTHRWSFKPEVGVSKALGSWTLEFSTAVAFYTTNEDFFGGISRAQAPVVSLQGHVIRNFSSGIWGSLDATWFGGGRTTLDGTRSEDLQQNWRAGATLVFPVDPHNSIKLYASRGTSARTGNNFDLAGVAWQVLWGAGL